MYVEWSASWNTGNSDIEWMRKNWMAVCCRRVHGVDYFRLLADDAKCNELLHMYERAHDPWDMTNYVSWQQRYLWYSRHVPRMQVCTSWTQEEIEEYAVAKKRTTTCSIEREFWDRLGQWNLSKQGRHVYFEDMERSIKDAARGFVDAVRRSQVPYVQRSKYRLISWETFTSVDNDPIIADIRAGRATRKRAREYEETRLDYVRRRDDTVRFVEIDDADATDSHTSDDGQPGRVYGAYSGGEETKEERKQEDNEDNEDNEQHQIARVLMHRVHQGNQEGDQEDAADADISDMVDTVGNAMFGQAQSESVSASESDGLSGSEDDNSLEDQVVGYGFGEKDSQGIGEAAEMISTVLQRRNDTDLRTAVNLVQDTMFAATEPRDVTQSYEVDTDVLVRALQHAASNADEEEKAKLHEMVSLVGNTMFTGNPRNAMNSGNVTKRSALVESLQL